MAMKKEDAMAGVYAILSSISDLKDGYPSGSLYSDLMSIDSTLYTFDNYNQMLGFMTGLGFVTVKNHRVTITETGKVFVARIDDKLSIEKATA